MAARTLNNLTDTKIRKLAKPGLYGDGGKLYLRVSSASQKSWVFLYRWNGKTVEMGLGSLQDVGLAEARDRRRLQAGILAGGRNPIEERDRARELAKAEAAKGEPLTLKAAGAIFLDQGLGPASPRGRINFTRSVEKHAGKMTNMRLDAITTEHVLEALQPYWTAQPETADRLRKRVEAVLDWGFAKGEIAAPWSNPAAWGRLKYLLAKRDHETKPREAVTFEEAAKVVAAVRAMQDRYFGGSNCTAATELTILTVLRNSECRLADWSELDRAEANWTVPGERMKMGKDHTVPLSTAAVAVLDRMVGGEQWPASGLVFPSQWKPGQAVSETSTLRVLREAVVLSRGGGLTGVALRDAAKAETVTLHGWRSTFKDWSIDLARFSDEIGEECLAHLVGNRTRRAYRRGDNLEGRREVMEAWATFLATEWASNVKPLRRVA